ncbi:hypothetical protein VTL71DRAFT_10349 [Oculimacula yallundae]|uniref:Heterokaryon incompatibility domain-containing protein n=1 Tax=Oculimacula yallundae TaxID=86028 RepID=A0ABR4CSU6_9HELO
MSHNLCAPLFPKKRDDGIDGYERNESNESDRRDGADGSSGLSSPYRYSPLNEEAEEIRILTLIPGKFSDDIRITLETITFPKDGSLIPSFEALSYAWGSVDNKINVFMGTEGSDVLAVTQNLAIALPYLRLEQEPRVLWIDAICVNQEDLSERSSQVQRMANIYSRASRVVVWVGLETNDSGIAIDAFELICKHVAFDYTTRAWHPLSEEETWCDRTERLPFRKSQLLAIQNFLHRPWFERLWIWQEVRLASDSTIVLCGLRTILWISVCNVICYLLGKPFNTFEYSQSYSRRLISTTKLCDKGSAFSLLELFVATKRSVCSDPRDRVFALMSMLPPSDKAFGLVPDYTKSVSEVYYDIAVRHIRISGSMQILSLAGMVQRIQKLPTWVPDWSVPRDTNRLPRMRAASSSLSSGAYQLSDSTIQVTGVQIATIRWTKAFELTEQDFFSDIKRVVLEAKVAFPDTLEDPFVTATCRTVCCDQFAERYYPPPPEIQSLESNERALRDILQHDFTAHRRPHSATRDEREIFTNTAIHYCNHRSLFLSQSGGLGLGPKDMKAGDIAIVLLGLDSTMILRPMDNGRYALVGEAYCHGNMDGKALLGPLPSQYQPIECLDEESGGDYSSFLHQGTGKMSPEDPRLGELPVRWIKESHPKEEIHLRFFNQEIGKSTSRDPRLSPEALRARGVPLRTFDIV